MTMKRLIEPLFLIFLAGIFVAAPTLAVAKGPSWKSDDQFGQKQQRETDGNADYERGEKMGGKGKKWKTKGNKSGRGSSPGQEKKNQSRSKMKNSYGKSDRSDFGKNGKNQKAQTHFREKDRQMLHNYFSKAFRDGHCPPGLAKKKNGCMPKGARKWTVGHPLPRDVVFHNLPPEVVEKLDPPPAKHRYVRVASDILLITIGTGMVVDALEDLGRVLDQ